MPSARPGKARTPDLYLALTSQENTVAQFRIDLEARDIKGEAKYFFFKLDEVLWGNER